jgi:hypothetical protein
VKVRITTAAPTAEEFDDMIRRHERQHAIPWRLRDLEKWVAQTKADPKDIRNTPDERPSKHGGTFVSEVSDLDSILKHINAVWRHFRANEFELALSSLRGLESRVQVVQLRVLQPDVDLARRVGHKTPEAAERAKRDRALTEEKYRRYEAAFVAALKPGVLKGKAEVRAARQCGCSVRTIRTAVKVLSGQ